MRHSFKTGLSFGITSGIITTLGLIVGLNAGTHSKLIVIGGILTIAIADSLSDALGIHISEESKPNATQKEIWESTLSTLLTKFIFALSFIIPVLLLNLKLAIIISILWGLLALAVLSAYIAKRQQEKPWKVIGEHILIALVVIILTNYIGQWINQTFN